MDRLDSYILYYVVVNTVLMINIQVSQKNKAQIPWSPKVIFDSFQ